MKILFIGDVVGSVGRQMVIDTVPHLKEEKAIDMVICNGENAAHGKGITKKIYNQLIAAGIDVITMGNHTFSKNDILLFIDEADRLVRPMNMEPTEPGQSTCVVKIGSKKIAVSNLSGEVFMNNITDSPFACMEDILEVYEDCDLHVVDLHAEATSEKIAFTYCFANQLAAVVGTHTHVQTADERIVDGCAAITDLGMCGPYNSVLGRDIDEVIARFTGEKTKYTMASGTGIFCGLIVEIDDISNRAVGVERIQIKEEG